MNVTNPLLSHLSHKEQGRDGPIASNPAWLRASIIKYLIHSPEDCKTLIKVSRRWNRCWGEFLSPFALESGFRIIKNNKFDLYTIFSKRSFNQPPLKAEKKVLFDDPTLDPMATMTEKNLHFLSLINEKGGWKKIAQREKKEIKIEEIPYHALKARKKEFINSFQYATALLYWSVLSNHPKDQLIFADYGDHLFKLIIDDSLSYGDYKPLGRSQEEHAAGSLLDGLQKAKFYSYIAQAPFSEQGILLVAIKEHSGSPLYEFTRKMKNFRALIHAQLNGKEYILIPSVSIVEAFLKAQVFDNKNLARAVTIKPNICLDPIEALYDNQSRPLLIPSPWENIPEKVDGLFYGPDYFVSLHDIQHLIFLNCYPEKLKKAFLLWIDGMRELQKCRSKGSVEHSFFKRIEELLLDSDEPLIYIRFGIRRKEHFDASETLLSCLCNIFRTALFYSLRENKELDPVVWEQIVKYSDKKSLLFSKLGIPTLGPIALKQRSDIQVWDVKLNYKTKN